MTQKLIVNEELKNLLPPLSDEEYAGLEASLLKDGCLSPLITWNNMIVDGHYRYEICKKYGIPFSVCEVNFPDLEAAKHWAWKHQENRRNLTPFYRAELALKFKDAIAKKAKARQQMARKSEYPLPRTPIKTATEVAKLAGVSHDTVHRVEYICSVADEETKNRLRRGDKSTSINREYNRLKLENPSATAITPQSKIIQDEESGMLLVRNDTTPEELATFIVDHFPAEFVRDVIRSFLKMYDLRYGTEATQHFLLKNCAEYID